MKLESKSDKERARVDFNISLTFWTLLIMISLLTAIDRYEMHVMQEEIDSMQQEIDSMPHYDCYMKTTERWITLVPRVCWEEGKYHTGKACSYVDANLSYNASSDEVNCEGEFVDDEYYRTVYNIDSENNTCIIKTTKQVCDIVKKDAIKGDKE